MTVVTTAEAQAMLPRLLASVARGEEVPIAEGGLPIARPIQPASRQSPPPARETAGEEDEERPWRGVFAIEGRGEPYPEGQLHLPPAYRPSDRG
jgi:antitoxin (DNA-binding transcriptional repressor) of toxin-antitoxin stability system